MDCDIAFVSQMPIPEVKGEPVVVHGQAGGQVGAAVSIASARSTADWWRVLRQPETAYQWLPPEIGIKHGARLDKDNVYQAVDVSILFGAFHFARQTVADITWLDTTTRLESCWVAGNPASWPETKEYDTGAPWQTQATGGWLVTPTPSGTVATYRVWASQETVFPALQSWAVGRTLPAMITAYSARVDALAGSGG